MSKEQRYRLILLLPMAALLLLTRCATTSVTSTQTVLLGDAMNNQNRYPEAIGYYEAYLENSPSLGLYRNYELESNVCRKLAHAYSTQGQYSESLRYLQQAYQLDTETNRNLLHATEDLRLLGLTYTYMGDYNKAIGYLRQSLEQTEGMETSAKSARKLAVADTHLSLANVHLALGNLEAAIEYADQSLAIYEQLPDETVGKAEALLIRGRIQTIRFELEDATDWVSKSKALFEAQGLNTSRHLQAEGELLRLQGDLEGSLRKRLEALDEAEKSQIAPQIVWAHLRVGDAFTDLGDDENAMEYYRRAQQRQQNSSPDSASLQPSIQMRLGDVERAREVWSRSGSALGLAITNLKLGRHFLATEQPDSAFAHFLEAQAGFRQVNSAEGRIASSLGLSQCLTAEGNYEESLTVLNKTLQLNALSGSRKEPQWQLLFQKGITFDGLNLPDSAIQMYFEAIDIIESIRGSLTIEEFRSSFFEDKTIVYDRLISDILKKGVEINYRGKPVLPGELAFMFNERARSRTFLDMLGNKKVPARAPDDSQLLGREQALRLKIQQLGIQLQKGNLSGSGAEEMQLQLAATQDEYHGLLQQIKLRSPAYGSMVSPNIPSVADLQSKIEEGTAIVEYWIGREQVVVWVASHAALQQKVLRLKRSELARELRSLRNAIRFNVTDEIHETLHLLHSQLIEPVEDWLISFDNLVIIPHQSLHFLPFQALIDRKGSYLVTQKNLSYSPSAAVYYLGKRRDKTGTGTLGLALGNHTIGGHKPLPGTEFEVAQIAQFYQEYTPKYGDQSSEAFFKKNAGQYGLIHIATHGVLSDTQPLYSYLLMSAAQGDDGRLTVSEIMDLNLGSRLVTLSACETALGDLNSGDELVGLSRAFIYAGAGAVVVSLWTVDDLSTSLLMTKFHQFLNEEHSPSEALNMAQRELLKQDFQLSDSRGNQLEWGTPLVEAVGDGNNFGRSPYYWAPFVLIESGN